MHLTVADVFPNVVNKRSFSELDNCAFGILDLSKLTHDESSALILLYPDSSYT